MKILVLDVDYEKDKKMSYIRIWGINERGEKILAIDKKFRPYLYVLPGRDIKEVESKVKELTKDFIENIEIEKMIIDREKKVFLKIFGRNSQDPAKIRDKIKHLEIKRGGNLIIDEFEYDINFYKKYLIDKGFGGFHVLEIDGEEVKNHNYNVDKVMIINDVHIENTDEKILKKINYLAIDIEVIETNGEIEIGMISLYGKDVKKVLSTRKIGLDFVSYFKSEKELLMNFLKIVKEINPDIIFTYNGDLFDWSIIRDRFEKYKINYSFGRDGNKIKYEKRGKISSVRIPGIVHIDLYVFINNILSPQLQTEVLTLDAVSEELLGERKIDVGYEEFLDLWKRKENLELLAKYNIKDSELTYKLGLFLLPQIIELSKIVGQVPWDVSRYTYSQLVEWFLAKKSKERKRIIPNQPKWEEIKYRRLRKTYIGGFVKEPKAGIHENIAVLDFRSLYPSIMATFNVSPETINVEDCKENSFKIEGITHWTCKQPEGFVSSVVKELIEKRLEIKKKLKSLDKNSNEYKLLDYEQKAIKTISNAMYGSFAYSGARWYCYECAEFLAALGRKFIQDVMNEAENFGFEIIYGDTDSVFLKSKGDIEKKAIEFLEFMNNKLPGYVELDFQGVYKRGIFIPKSSKDSGAKKRYALLDFDGNLTVRGLETVRRDWCKLAKKVQRDVLEIILKEMNVEKAVKYVREVIERLRKGEIEIKDLVIYEQLTKPIEEYKQISPHVVAARKMKERGISIFPGMIILYVITKGSGSISERAEPIEFVKKTDIDFDYYINNQIIPAALRILQVLDINEEKIKGKTGLERFF